MTRRSAFLIVSLSLGCSGTNDKPVPTASERDSARAPGPADEQGGNSAPAAHESNVEKTPTAPPQAVAVTPPPAPPHGIPLSPSTPSVKILKEVTGCRPMPSQGLTPDQLVAQKLLKPLRELSCKPELMGKPLSEIISATSAPPELDLHVDTVYRNRLSHLVASGDASSASVASIAAAAGINAPELKLQQGSVPRWVVVAGGEDVAPILWGVARLKISVRGAPNESKKAGTTKAIENDTTPRSVSIQFDHDVLRYDPDPDPAASKAIASALLAIADKPELLELSHEEINEELLVLGERFLLRASKRTGIVIWPRRTKLRAMDLVQALGFPAGAVQQTNVGGRPNRFGNVLEAGGRTKIPWRGLVLEVSVTRTADGTGLQPWLVRDVTVLHPETKPTN